MYRVRGQQEGETVGAVGVRAHGPAFDVGRRTRHHRSIGRADLDRRARGREAGEARRERETSGSGGEHRALRRGDRCADQTSRTHEESQHVFRFSFGNPRSGSCASISTETHCMHMEFGQPLYRSRRSPARRVAGSAHQRAQGATRHALAPSLPERKSKIHTHARTHAR